MGNDSLDLVFGVMIQQRVRQHYVVVAKNPCGPGIRFACLGADVDDGIIRDVQPGTSLEIPQPGKQPDGLQRFGMVQQWQDPYGKRVSDEQLRSELDTPQSQPPTAWEV